ncbi:TraQ conjugal transfer family protein [Flagellimonas sp.]|uniref:TraQ conjugal transfer family protein n=1 Tax=Flagellimonas sp. TaxID=2058762 RepID=UPI003BA9E054
MKFSTPQRIVAIGTLCMIFILACSKDFEGIVQDSFDFNFDGTNEENGFVFEAVKTDFSLEPERMVSTVSYFMKYDILDGRGYYLGTENDTIRENDTILIKDFDPSYRYMPIDTGMHRVKVLAWDSNKIQKELELTYRVRHASFSFLLTKGTDDFIINSRNPINVTLLRDRETFDPSKETDEDFEITYQLEDGSGKLFLGENTYEVGTPFMLPKGVTEFSYQPETLGEHKLTMTAKAPDGATLTNELLLAVENINFTFRATAASSQVELETNLAVNIDLQTPEEESEVTFDISHSFSSDSQGAGTLRDQNGGVMDPGTFRNINPGNYNFTFEDDELGQRKIYFDLRDSNGQMKRDSVEIEVANIPFTFSGNSESNQVFVNQRTQLNFNIKSNGNTSNIDYFLTYNLVEGNGSVTGINGDIIQNNTDYSVELGNFPLFYTPETLGPHLISFFVTDNYGQEVGPVEIDLEARQLELEFNASANGNEVLVGQRGTISLSLIEKGDYNGVAYELNYFISGGEAQLYNRNSPIVPSQYFTVRPGSFAYDFIAQEAGTYEITFLLRDSNGQILEEKVTVVVGNNDFTVSMTPSKATEFSNIPVGIIVDIDEVPEGANDSYSAFFSSSQNGSMSVNGVVYGPGEEFPLGAGVNNLAYTGLEPGQHNIILSVESASDVTRTANTTITYDQVDFTFTAGTQKSDITVGETTGLNFNISESVGSSDYTMRFSMNGNALIRDNNGIEVSPGNSYDVNTGNFNWTLEGTNESTVRLAFTVRNDTGLEKTVDITVNVAAKDYTFTASGTLQQAYTGEQVDMNFNISEIGIGGDTYEMYFSASGNNGSFEYEGTSYSAGESFDVPVGAFSGKYTGTTEGNHNITFTVRSSSDVEKTASVNINYTVYEEPFELTISQAPGERLEGEPFNITVITNAIGTHDQDVTYQMTFSFSGNRVGYFLYGGNRYDEGQTIPLNYGSTNLTFYPESQNTFTIDFEVENSTGQSQIESTFVDTIRKPMALVKGEKHNVSCGGLNGCDYQVRIYTCFDIGCSEAYGGATLDQVEIRIFNRSSNRWDTRLFNYNEATGNGVDRYFMLEEEPRESRLKYLDQDFEVRVRDTNGQWSERVTGRVVRV